MRRQAVLQRGAHAAIELVSHLLRLLFFLLAVHYEKQNKKLYFCLDLRSES
jgi:hypothetical protein